MIGYFAKDRDVEEILIPTLTACAAQRGIKVAVGEMMTRAPMHGYFPIEAWHADQSEIDWIKGMLHGMMTLFNVLSDNDIVDALEVPRPNIDALRQLVKSNIEAV